MAIPDLAERLTPASGVTVTALPFDRDSLTTAMEREHGGGRPFTDQLDSLYNAFKGPFLAYFTANQARSAISDSVSAGSLPASALLAADTRLAEARQALSKARTAVGDRIDSLRGAVARWEDSTYAGYDGRAKELMRQTGGKPISDTTNSAGEAVLTLPSLPGGWWVSASSWDPLDPNRTWYWNVKVTGDTVMLDPESGRRRSR